MRHRIHSQVVKNTTPALLDLAEADSSTCLDLFLPHTRTLARELLERVCDIFPSPYIHIGFDECYDLARSLPRHIKHNHKYKEDVFIEHLCFVCGLVFIPAILYCMSKLIFVPLFSLFDWVLSQ